MGIRLLARELARDIQSKGIQEALAAFEQNRAKGSKTYFVDEQEMNSIGYELLGTGRHRDAIEVFKLNVREYPQSSNTYDSLGEAYMAAGQNDLAILNYRKSLELDPRNQNAVVRLGRLGAKP
jgi:tetratricopeptide (TPR) repeat protein